MNLTQKEQLALAAVRSSNAARQIASETLAAARDACADAGLGSEIRSSLDQAAEGLGQAKNALDYAILLIEN